MKFDWDYLLFTLLVLFVLFLYGFAMYSHKGDAKFKHDCESSGGIVVRGVDTYLVCVKPSGGKNKL